MATVISNPLPNKRTSNYEPYRATKLWNDVIELFRSSLPVGRHRRQLKSYDSCFVGSEAVSWLHHRLKDNKDFNPHVTRSQTVQLLQKFHRARLFEDVRGPKHDKDDISDGGRLFRFLPNSPSKGVLLASKTPIRTPLATRTSLMNSDSALARKPPLHTGKLPLGKGHSVACLPGDMALPCQAPKTADLPRKHIRILPQRSQSCRRDQEGNTSLIKEVQLSETEKEKIWKDVTLNSIKKYLQLKTIGEVLDSECVNVKYLLHNMTQVNKNGLVTNIDKKDQLPHWIISAMRCLAYWPERVEENLPDYPGFERDVFRVIEEYFMEMEEPLITFQLYEFFLSVMVFADGIGKPHIPGKPGLRQAVTTNTPNLPSSISVENLIMNMTNQDVFGPDDVLIINDPDVTICPGRPHSSRRRLPRSLSGSSLPGTRIETSFGVDNQEPKTRLYQQTLSSGADDYGYHSNSQEYSDFDEYQRPDHVLSNQGGPQMRCRPYSICANSDNVFFPGAADEEENHMFSQNCISVSNVRNIRAFPGARLAEQGRANSWMSIQSVVPHEDHRRLSTAPSYTHPPYQYGPPPYSHNPPPYKPPPSYKATVHKRPQQQQQPLGVPRWAPDNFQYPEVVAPQPEIYLSPELQPAGSALDLSRSLPSLTRTKSKCNLAESYRQAIDATGPTSTPIGQSLYSGHSKLQRCSSSPSVLTPVSRNCVYEILQLCCLLLPPANRRKLHLLLRFMNKVSNNERLSVAEDITMKDLVLRTFTRCILRSEDDIDHELLTQQIVTFMMEGYVDIMKVPDALTERFNEKVLATKKAKLRSTWDSDGSDIETPDEGPTVTYCQQVTMATYEKQKMSSSQQALHTLLEEIVQNNKMNDKEKKRHLKQFQKNHPRIYSKRFPSTKEEEQLFPTKPHIKPPLLSKPLLKLKSLRL